MSPSRIPSLKVFAKADYDPAKPSVEAVLDSSRYFVVRVEDNGRRAYIGMGFLERTDSFDFSEYTPPITTRTELTHSFRCRTARLYQVRLLPIDCAGLRLNHATRRWRARMNPSEATSDPSPHVPTGPKKDYTLKEGQTFSISIPGRSKPTSALASGPNLLGGGSGSSSGGAIPALLPPPPSAPRKR